MEDQWFRPILSERKDGGIPYTHPLLGKQPFSRGQTSSPGLKSAVGFYRGRPKTFGSEFQSSKLRYFGIKVGQQRDLAWNLGNNCYYAEIVHSPTDRWRFTSSNKSETIPHPEYSNTQLLIRKNNNNNNRQSKLSAEARKAKMLTLSSNVFLLWAIEWLPSHWVRSTVDCSYFTFFVYLITKTLKGLTLLHLLHW